MASGEARFVMSLRSIGEGHISSIEFRSGVVGADAAVRLDQPSAIVAVGERRPSELDKVLFAAKLVDLGVFNEVAVRVLERLRDRFTVADIEEARSAERDGIERSIAGETTRLLHWLASSNYRFTFPSTGDISERVLFPAAPPRARGWRMPASYGSSTTTARSTYFATYTAFDGHQILPQLLETDDFSEFRVTTMSGAAARNKGIALFPA